MKALGSALAVLMRPLGNAFGFTCVLSMDLHVTSSFSVFSFLSPLWPGLLHLCEEVVIEKGLLLSLLLLLGFPSGGVNNGELKQQGCLKSF